MCFELIGCRSSCLRCARSIVGIAGHALKVDQSFVRQINAAGEDTAIVTAVISMARSLNLRVIAEGVETQEELAFLRARQCDEAQGYYFSRQLPAEQFAM